MSDGLQRVVIVTPDAVAPVDHDAAMVALVDSKNAAAIERPEWLPEKFKTVEEMAASYKELEAKQSAPKPAAAAPTEVPLATLAAPVKADPLAVPSVAPEAAAAVAKAGLDMAALNAEFAKDGAVSADSYTKLAAAGFDKSTVDNYVAGQQALVAAFQSDVMSATPGGADKYGEMMAWAKANLSDAEAAAYNAAVSTNSRDQAKLAVAGLGVKFTAAVGNEPLLSGGRVAAGETDVFESIAQMKEAMSDKRYKTDSAFRRTVAAKLGRSSIM